jgi:predicted dinucleotide-binding enzyme
MRIAVMGSGNVGRTLASGLQAKGHDVTLATREPSRPELGVWSAETGVAVDDLASAAAGAELVVLATAWSGVAEALAAVGPGNLDGKVLVDVTNPLRFTDRLELAVGHGDSGGETVQRFAPGARVVKAFNTVGFELMVDPDVPGGPPTMFVAGDDPDARSVVAGLAAALGWAVHDCGDLRAARLTEPLAMLWIEHALRTGQRSHAFRLLGL